MRGRCAWIIAAAGTVVLCASHAAAQSTADERAKRMAYDIAIKCFVANGVARSDALNAGRTAVASSFDAKARNSFDMAVKLGDALGFDGDRVSQDFGLAQVRELPKMITDTGYFRQAASTCKQAGLM